MLTPYFSNIVINIIFPSKPRRLNPEHHLHHPHRDNLKSYMIMISSGEEITKPTFAVWFFIVVSTFKFPNIFRPYFVPIYCQSVFSLVLIGFNRPLTSAFPCRTTTRNNEEVVVWRVSALVLVCVLPSHCLIVRQTLLLQVVFIVKRKASFIRGLQIHVLKRTLGTCGRFGMWSCGLYTI